MSIGIGMIGSGIFARAEHVPAICQLPQLKLRAVYSRRLQSAQALATDESDVDLYADDAGQGKSYEDLLKRPDIFGVIIVLPIDAQPSYIESALKAGKCVLSEKPIAADTQQAKRLLDEYQQLRSSSGPRPTWSVAENYRFHDSLLYGRDQVRTMGSLLGFRVQMFTNIKPGTKYFETPWRKTPSYQGGFLLDGGIHLIAGLRLLLDLPSPLSSSSSSSSSSSDQNQIVRVSAQIGQLQAHLPPADTLDAILLTRSGISGTFSLSFGTTFSDSTIAIACRHGTVTVSDRGKKVTVRHVPNPPPTNANDDTTGTTNHPTGPTMTDREVKDHRQDQWTKEFDQGSGVKEELSSWAQHLLDQAGMATTTTVGDTNEVRRGSRGRGGHGSNDDNNDDDDDKNIIKQDDRQSPEEALADLILLETMFRSGAQAGLPLDLDLS